MICVIGGGPIGLYLSSLLDGEVSVFEEHKEIGKPVQCTGILTSSIKELINLDRNIIINEIDKMRLVSPNNTECEFNLSEKEIIVDRDKFDKYLGDKAKEKGVKIFINHRLKDFKISDKINLKFDNGKSVNADKLVGADGPNSFVGRNIGLIKDRKFKRGYQYRVKGKYDKETAEVYFFNKGFGWIVPENEETARIGAAGDKEIFNNFLNRINVNKKDFIECQSGLIPKYDPELEISKDNVFLIGDAAGHVKGTSLGGIVYGMRGANILADVLNNKKENYDKLVKKEIGKDLKLHNKINKFLEKFNEKDYDEFIELLKNINLGKFNRDKPFSGLRLFLRPSLIMFLTKKYLTSYNKP